MRIALLGLNARTQALLQTALAHGHTLVAAYEVGALPLPLREALGEGLSNEGWESILVGDRADVVLVAGPPADRAWDEFESDRLRKLVQEAIPVLLAPPLLDVNLAYELEMIRRERGGIILADSPDWRHPGIEKVQSIVNDSAADMGTLEQMVFERRLADRSRASVLAQFVQDAAILRRMLGTIKTVSATGAPSAEYRDPMAGGPKPVKPLSSVTVHLTGSESFGARWSVAPPGGDVQAIITLMGTLGEAKLTLHADSRESGMTIVSPTGEKHTEFPESAERYWSAVQNVLRRRAELPSEAVADWKPTLFPAWLDVCHDLEAAEAIDRSLLRGRTVSVTTDEPSEEEAFKGIMAAGGCLTLLLSLGLFLLAGAVETLKLPVRELAIWRYSPVLPLLPIGLYLLLQLFRFAVPPRGQQASSP